MKGDQSRRPRILFLADRNILADQAYNNFSAFKEDALVRIDPEIIRKKGRVPKNGSVFFTIFQTFMTGADADGNPVPSFGEYPPDFFDFIVNVDTYHYFGESVYVYSLKEGINDGYLTPFRVKQTATTLDEYVYTSDDEIVEGEIELRKRYDD